MNPRKDSANLSPGDLAPKNRAQRRALVKKLRALTPRRFRKFRRIKNPDGSTTIVYHPALRARAARGQRG